MRKKKKASYCTVLNNSYIHIFNDNRGISKAKVRSRQTLAVQVLSTRLNTNFASRTGARSLHQHHLTTAAETLDQGEENLMRDCDCDRDTRRWPLIGSPSRRHRSPQVCSVQTRPHSLERILRSSTRYSALPSHSAPQ